MFLRRLLIIFHHQDHHRHHRQRHHRHCHHDHHHHHHLSLDCCWWWFGDSLRIGITRSSPALPASSLSTTTRSSSSTTLVTCSNRETQVCFRFRFLCQANKQSAFYLNCSAQTIQTTNCLHFVSIVLIVKSHQK